MIIKGCVQRSPSTFEKVSASGEFRSQTSSLAGQRLTHRAAGLLVVIQINGDTNREATLSYSLLTPATVDAHF